MKSLTFVFCLLTTVFLQAQSTETIPRLLVGIEANAHLEDVTSRSNNLGFVGIGLSIEKPIGQFSIGTALIRQRFGPQTFRQFTGEVKPNEGLGPDIYTFRYQQKNISFWNIPLRLQYRLPCNCVYVQAGLQTSISDLKGTPGDVPYTNPSFFAPGPSPYALNSISKISVGYEMAIGLNFHLSENWKLNSRLTYTHYGYFKDTPEAYRRLGDTFMGLNIGLQRAIY